MSRTNAVSTRTGKTANQSTSREVVEETLRQLRIALPQLPDPDAELVSPQNHRQGRKWTQHDTSYVATQAEPGPLPSHGRIANLYNVGTHNQQSTFPNTTLESAVANALALARRFGADTPKPQRLWTLRTAIATALVVLLVLTVAQKTKNFYFEK